MYEQLDDHAKLDIYDPNDGWLSVMFPIEILKPVIKQCIKYNLKLIIWYQFIPCLFGEFFFKKKTNNNVL